MFIQTYSDDVPESVYTVHVVTNLSDGCYPFNDFYVFDDFADADEFVNGLSLFDDFDDGSYSNSFIEFRGEYCSLDDAVESISRMNLYGYDIYDARTVNRYSDGSVSYERITPPR